MGSSLSSSSKEEWTATSRNVLITGASDGIGAELARKFAAEGANLALVARNKAKLEAVKKECQELSSSTSGSYSNIYCCDLTKNDEIISTMERIIGDFNGGIDVVIMNAGRSQGCFFDEIQDINHIDYMMSLNVGGVTKPLQKLLPHIYKSKNSRIVVISSVAGLVPVPYRTIYCASKAAINAFCGSLRMELHERHYDSTQGKKGDACVPRVCVINFPEVSGTSLNADRLNFGATLPPSQFDPNTAQNLGKSCEQCIEAIRRGDRSWGQSTKIKLLLPLYGIIPKVLDNMILKHTRKTMSRSTASTTTAQ